MKEITLNYILTRSTNTVNSCKSFEQLEMANRYLQLLLSQYLEKFNGRGIRQSIRGRNRKYEIEELFGLLVKNKTKKIRSSNGRE